MSEACEKSDLVNRKVSWLLWRVPILLILAGIFVEPIARMLLWTPAFLVMGGACVANAARCGRLHCYITAPVFLGSALASLLLGLGALNIQWSWIGIGAAAGTVLAYVPEWIRGRYLART